jgi:hypothetical protein
LALTETTATDGAPQAFVRQAREKADKGNVAFHKRTLHSAELVLYKMAQLGMLPDEKTYSLLLKEYLKSTHYIKIKETATAMKAAGMQPEVVMNEALRERALWDVDVLRPRMGSAMTILEAMQVRG